MKRRNEWLCGLGVGLLLMTAAAGPAQTGGARAGSASPETVAKFKETVRLLSSEDFKERQRGEAAVQSLPPDALELVQRAVEDPKVDPEVRARLKRALPAFQTKAVTASAEDQEAADEAWLLKVTLAAYDQGTHRDPRWDALVHEAFTAELQVGPETLTVEFAGHSAGMFKKAVDAGADDPLVLHAYAAELSRTPTADRKEVHRLVSKAAERFNRENYPPVLKLAGFMAAMDGVSIDPGDPGDDEAQVQRYYDLAAGQWPEVAKMEGIPDAQLFKWSNQMLGRAKDMLKWEEKGLVLSPLEQAKPTSPCTWYLRGKDAMGDAWAARGYGTADTVTPERQREMEEACSRARADYEQAWRANPHSPWAPAAMIEVELLSPSGGSAQSGRQAMEEWFKRAMDANPDNEPAVTMKLNYLRSRWYGSDAELLGFAREMVAKGHVPMALITAHEWLSQESGNPAAYYAQPVVWLDIKRVYLPLLAKNPGSVFDRSWFLKYAAYAGDWQVAAAQIKLLGDHPAVNVFGSLAAYDALRKQVAKRVAN